MAFEYSGVTPKLFSAITSWKFAGAIPESFNPATYSGETPTLFRLIKSRNIGTPIPTYAIDFAYSGVTPKERSVISVFRSLSRSSGYPASRIFWIYSPPPCLPASSAFPLRFEDGAAAGAGAGSVRGTAEGVGIGDGAAASEAFFARTSGGAAAICFRDCARNVCTIRLGPQKRCRKRTLNRYKAKRALNDARCNSSRKSMTHPLERRS